MLKDDSEWGNGKTGWGWCRKKDEKEREGEGGKNYLLKIWKVIIVLFLLEVSLWL